MYAIILMLAEIAVGASETSPTVLECTEGFRASISRIQTLEVVYTETWEPLADPSALLTKALEWQRAENLRRLEQASTPEDRQSIEQSLATIGARHTESLRWLDAPPDLKLEIQTETEVPGQASRERSSVHGISGGRHVHLDSHHQTASIRASADVTGLWILPQHALGRRLRGTTGLSLDQLLSESAVVRVLGTETLGDLETVRLQVGPDLPDALRPAGEDAEYFGRIWLAPDRDWLPLRIEWWDRDSAGTSKDVGPDGVERSYSVQRYELEQIEEAPDEARDSTVFFPRRIRFTDAGGTRTALVERVRVNPEFEPAEFQPTIPSGYLVSEDGTVPVIQLSGGGAALEEKLNSNSAQAKGMVSPKGIYLVIIGNGIFVSVCLLVLLIRKRRQRDEET